MGAVRPLAAASLLLLLAMTSCSASGGGSDATVADGPGQETLRAGCSGLGEEACKASDSCTVIEGWPMLQACLVAMEDPAGGLPQFAGCRDGSELLCPAAFGWAHPADHPDEVWLFPYLCFPDGWVKAEGAPCAPPCPESECIVGEVTCVQGAEVYCEDACPDNPECSPCGTWGDTKYPCETYAMCPEELGHCACPHTECDWCCPSDDHVCDELGQCCLPDCTGKECGDDGCGEACGACGDNAVCAAGGTCACEFTDCGDACCTKYETTCDDFGCCEPNCEGRECGDNGCLGKCGQCPESAPFCDEEGQCRAQCTPDCDGRACGQDDGCGGKCGDCPVECTAHAECGAGQVCLGEPDIGPPFEVCGLCGDVETCHCAKPLWPDLYYCTADAECEQSFMCGDKCDDCPVTCPQCIHGWCAYETFDFVECLCTGCA